MALTSEEEDRMQTYLDTINENTESLTGWETQFISDMTERFEKYSGKMFMSPKQWTVMRRIFNKVTGQKDGQD